MKLFYILMLTALLSLFNIGCGSDDVQEGGQPQQENTDPEAGEKFTVFSLLTKSTAFVESGDQKAELKINQCIAVPKDMWGAVKISAKAATEEEAVVLCDQSDEENKCGARHLSVRKPPGEERQVTDSQVTACSTTLGEESEEDKGDDKDKDGAEKDKEDDEDKDS